MANALAIAAVSAVLKDLLNNGLIDAQLGTDVSVRVGPPLADRGQGNPNEGTQLNLFLYQVAPNPTWSHQGLPSRNGRGDRIAVNPLALDLRYLLTAYGTDEFEAEILLGYAMQLLHETPILSRGAIRRTFSTGSSGVDGGVLPSRYQALAAAGLADQVELIKISPEYLDTEAMARLWSSLQAHYRTSTAYHLSVVLIEPQETPRAAQPVLHHRVTARPLALPFIERVEPQLLGPGASLTLRGQSLRGNPTQVVFGNPAIAPVPLPAAPADPFTDAELRVPLPAGLRAGVNTVQVLHPLDLGTPSEPHRGVESNLAAFVLRPTLRQTAAGPPPSFELALLPNQAAFNAAFSAAERQRLTRPLTFPAVRLGLGLAVQGNQRLVLLLNETPPPGDRAPRTASFGDPALLIAAADVPAGGTAAELPPADQRSEVLVFATPGLGAGSYLVRVRIDGADSPLVQAAIAPGADPSDPMQPFVGPAITVAAGGGP
jgi:hypothetical protein